MRTITSTYTPMRRMRPAHTLMALAIVCAAAAPITAFAQDAAAKPRSPQSERADSTTTTVNLNTASAAELEALPGIGPATATRILEFRQKNGPFKKIEDLMNVKGIGEKSFLKLKPLVTVGPARGERPSA